MKGVPFMIEILIHKKLTNQLNAEENAAFEQWINASNDHPLIFAEYRTIWEAGARLKPELKINPETAYARYSQKYQIAGSKAGEMRRMRMRSNVFLRFAAAACLLGLFVFAGLKVFNYSNKVQTISTNLRTISTFNLEDGTVVKLNKGSSLSFPKHFKKGNRNVTLKGEAFFEVSKDAQRPFVIHVSEGDITVLGTSFNVFQGDNRSLSILVTSGQVKFTPENSSTPVFISKGEKMTFDSEGIIQKEMDLAANDLAWFRKTLQFENVSLTQVLKDISKFYAVDIRADRPCIDELRFSSPGDLSLGTNIEQVLRIVTTPYPMLRVSKSAEGYLISGNCK
ncbi:MAG: FecR domain-containing protein [Saprospiraceae bacterium]|nr:FecR domain-containing protein [Saprospiraceae bacterium]